MWGKNVVHSMTRKASGGRFRREEKVTAKRRNLAATYATNPTLAQTDKANKREIVTRFMTDFSSGNADRSDLSEIQSLIPPTRKMVMIRIGSKVTTSVDIFHINFSAGDWKSKNHAAEWIAPKIKPSIISAPRQRKRLKVSKLPEKNSGI